MTIEDIAQEMARIAIARVAPSNLNPQQCLLALLENSLEWRDDLDAAFIRACRDEAGICPF